MVAHHHVILKCIFGYKKYRKIWKKYHSDDQSLGITVGTYYRSYEINEKFNERKGVYLTTWIK